MDLELYFRFLLALGLVLGLIGAAAWAMKRFGLNRFVGQRRPGSADRRLSIVETLPLDAKRRLILIRRDGVEHLLLTGAGADLVIETRIPAPPGPAEMEQS